MNTGTSQSLPLLRPDVEFLPGPDDADGCPTFVIHDPLQGTFDRATWVQAQVLRLLRVPRTLDRVLAQLRATTTIRVSGDDVRRLCADATLRGLTVNTELSDSPAPQAAPAERPSLGERRGATE